MGGHNVIAEIQRKTLARCPIDKSRSDLHWIKGCPVVKALAEYANRLRSGKHSYHVSSTIGQETCRVSGTHCPFARLVQPKTTTIHPESRSEVVVNRAMNKFPSTR